MPSNAFPYHPNYSSGTPVPAALRVLHFFCGQSSRNVPIEKVSKKGSRRWHVLYNIIIATNILYEKTRTNYGKEHSKRRKSIRLNDKLIH